MSFKKAIQMYLFAHAGSGTHMTNREIAEDLGCSTTHVQKTREETEIPDEAYEPTRLSINFPRKMYEDKLLQEMNQKNKTIERLKKL